MRRQSVRIITYAWGEPYINKLLSLTLPAVLAPGNLPALTEVFDCEVILLTEEVFFDRIRHSLVCQRLEKYCLVRLMMLDDLVANTGMYGLSLTMALHRGFADLGEEMTEYFLIFLNADFILANGSLGTLTRHMLNGERLIHSPSYCVVLEQVMPILRRRLTEKGCVLNFSPREMASLALDHRHNTIRAKTVNQRLFHIAYIEQFYWQVDDFTLLGHQMPIALVCMKPERVVTKMRTFWDYGVVSEFCPTAKPCVLGDSDDFLMIELRAKMTAHEQMVLGWPSVEQIAKTLSDFVTQDQKDLGLYSLVLHSRDLPKSIQMAKVKLCEFVDSVYRHMPQKAVDHLNHKFWVCHFESFQHYRAEFFERRRAVEEAEEVEARPTWIQDSTKRLTVSFIPSYRECRKNLNPHSISFVTACRKNLMALYYTCFGHLPKVRRWHPYWPDMNVITSLFSEALKGKKAKTLLLYSEDSVVGSMMESASTLHKKVSTATFLDYSFHESGFVSWEKIREGKIKGRSVLAEGSRPQPVPQEETQFDVCMCELNLEDLQKFSVIYEKIRPRMYRGGKVLVFYRQNIDEEKAIPDLGLLEYGFPLTDESRVLFVGSWSSKMALKIYSWGGNPRHKSAWLNLLRVVTAVVVSAPIALLASYSADSQNSQELPKRLTSLTIEIVIH